MPVMHAKTFRSSVFFLLVVAFPAILIISCGGQKLITQETAKQNKILVSTNAGYQLTLNELYTKLESSRLLPNGGILADDKLQSFVDSALVDTLLGLQASAVPLRQYFDYYRVYRIRYQDELMRSFFEQKMGASPEVDSQDVRAYYDSHKEQFTLPEQVLVYTILITPQRFLQGKDSLVYRPLNPEQRMQKAYEYAMDVRSKITSPDLFSEIAAKYSHASDAEASGGQLGWATRGIYFDPFDSVAFSLKIGEISMPYRDRDGWHILMVQDHVDAGLQPLEGEFYTQALSAVAMERVNEQGGKLLDSLKANLHITYHDSLMNADVYALPPDTWMGIVNGVDTIIADDMRDAEDGYRARFQIKSTFSEMKREMLQQLAVRPLVARAAITSGYDTLPELRATQQFLMHVNQKHVLRDQFEPPQTEPTQEEISQYYRAHQHEYMVDKPLVVQHIIAADSSFAVFLHDQAMSGVDFLELAKQYYPGEPKVRVALADMGAIGQSDVSPEFWQAALYTLEGNVTPPVKTANGYEVIKVIKHIQTRDESEAAPYIAQILKVQKAKEYVAQKRNALYATYGVKFTGPLPHIQLRPLAERSKDADNR